jgi:hypothetical protein
MKSSLKGRRPVIVAAAVTAVLAAGGIASASSASGAASTTITVIHVNSTSPETDTCGFVLNWHIQGSFKIMDFFDTRGTLVKEILTNTDGPFTVTVTNPATGKAATTQSSAEAVITTYNSDGSVNTMSINGVGYNFRMPSGPPLMLEVGSIVFDSNGNVLRITGVRDFSLGNTATFCAALS